MRVWLVVGVALELLAKCQSLALVATAGLPLVAPGAVGVLPVAALLSLEAAIIITLLKKEKLFTKHKGYKKDPEPDYYYEPPVSYEEPESSYVSYRSSYQPPESSYVSHRSFYRAPQSFPPPPPASNTRPDPSSGYGRPGQGYHKREAQETWREEVVEVEKLLVSAASRLDTDGCVLKLLCHLNSKQVHTRTMEENVLLQLFSSYPETLSSHDAAFLNAAADDSKSQEQEAVCDEMFPRCSLGQEELGSLLRHTWPCPTITL